MLKTKFDSNEIGNKCIYWYYNDGSGWSAIIEYDHCKVYANFIDFHIEIFAFKEYDDEKLPDCKLLLEVDLWVRSKIAKMETKWLRDHYNFYRG